MLNQIFKGVDVDGVFHLHDFRGHGFAANWPMLLQLSIVLI